MSARLMIGDVRQRIKEIPDGSVDLVCTSPPFLALRKYGDNPEGEMGSEATPAEFIDGLLSLTAEFRRVLAPHGSIAVELGDTFSGSGGAGGDYNEDGLRAGQRRFKQTRNAEPSTLHPNDPGRPLDKSLCLTPYLYPLGLAYGRNLLTGQAGPAGQWMVRNMIAWARPNPPVGDLADKVRPGTSYITVATTSPRRWFDLDAVRHPAEVQMGRAVDGNNTKGSDDKSFRFAQRVDSNPAGAPPLDWWEDDYDPADPVDAYTLGHMTLVQATQPYKGWTTTTRRVPCGPLDGGERTTSPDCPVHADLPGQLPKALRDARAGTESSSRSRSGTHHEQGSLLGSVPTAPSSAPTTAQPEPSPEHSHAASGRSTAANRTDHAPSTSAPGTSSSGTADGTHGTSVEPESGDLHPDTLSSSTCEDGTPSRRPEIVSGTAGTPAPASACTCSFHHSITERTSHYATWPKALAQRLILMMCPPKVCTICGVPSERITERSEEYAAARSAIGDFNQRPDGAGTSGSRSVLTAAAGRDVTCAENITVGWTDCGHDSWRQGCVLDPFAGSGTTLAVATGCGRDAIGIELYEANAHLIRERVGMFLEEVA